MDWHALYTRSRHEKRVEQRLRRIGVDPFLPLAPVVSRWTDRRKLIYRPLFPSYVFFESGEQGLFDVARVDGVIRVLGRSLVKPTIVEDRVIRSLKQLAASGVRVERCATFKKGDRARVVRGPLKGLEGTLITIRRRVRLVIWVKLIGSGAAVEVASDDVEPA